MDVFDGKHYVPILQTKVGELRAIEKLDDLRKKRLTPLFVIPPVTWDFIKDAPAKTIDVHLKKLIGEVGKSWSGRAAFIDGMYVEDEVMPNGTHSIEWVVSEAIRQEVPLVPVVAPNRSASYVAAVRKFVSQNEGTDVCIRLDVPDWPIAPADANLTDFAKALGLNFDRCHLVLDMRDQVGPAAAGLLKVALRALPSPSAWRSLTVSGSAMPQPLPSGRKIHEVERVGWQNYHSLVTAAAYGRRRPTFGDYAVSHPDPFADVDPRALQISAKLKYTTDDKWLIARGDLYKGNAGRGSGGEAIRPVARQLVARTEFTTKHCGSEGWTQAAAGSGPTGNPTTWVTIGTWHHLIRVLDQIAQT